MIQVSSSTCGPRKFRLLRASSMLVAVLATGLVGSALPAHADDLTDRRDGVRQAIVDAKKDIDAGKREVAAATTQLEKSQAKLSQAKRNLAVVSAQLDEARAIDRSVGIRLADAQRRLANAKQAVTRGESELAAQTTLIGEAARTAYQQQRALVGYSVVLGSDSLDEVAQRVQWSTTILDTSAAELGRLKELQAKLEAAKAEQASIEAEVSAQKADAERQVAAVRALERKAAAAKSGLQRLVSADTADKAQAQDDLAASKREYAKYVAQERRIGAEIKRRAEIARKQRLAEIARAKALAAKQHKKYVPRLESSKGFIYPVNASPGSPFGMRFHPILHYWRMHRGQDFGAACGAPLFAVADGRVASARRQGGFGNYTVIDVGFRNGKFVSVGYAHQSRMVVSAGQRVKQGQVIGYVGTTGLSTGCHLHFQVYVDGGVVNPMTYL